MKILFIMPLKIDPRSWLRLGDMKMACQICRQLGELHEIDIVGSFSEMSQEEKDNLKDYIHAHDFIDESKFKDHRQYITQMMKHLKESGILDSYDILHLHTSKLGMVSTTMTLRKEGTPIIVSFHSPPESREVMRFYRDNVIELCSTGNNAIVCNSSSHKQRMISALNYPEDKLPGLTYVYNGVEDIYSIPDTKDREFASGTIGRISSLKNIFQMLTMFRKLTDMTGKKCYIVGEAGAYEQSESSREYYEKCLPLLEDEKYITWYKSLTPEEISVLIKKADTYTMYGRVETFGLPILESGLSGVPSLVVDSAGLGEIVENGKNGFKCHVDKPIRWNAIYEESLENYKKCLDIDPQSIRDYTLDEYSVSKFGQAFDKLYKKVLNQEVE